MRYGWVLALFLSASAWATIDAYQFQNKDQEVQFRALIEELRCPKCQNQNIADSNAELAKDIKDRCYKLIKEGKSNSEISAYMVERYGDFITYRPPVKASTALLWFGPFVAIFLVAVFLIVGYRKRNSGKAEARAPKILSAEDQKRLEALLSDASSADSTEQVER